MSERTNRRIDDGRLWDSLMAMAAIGATPDGGVRRVALSETDRAGRDAFIAACREAGLTVNIDAIGNIFARREGHDPSRAPVLFGSHLDTQPSGGKFDGALGVMAGLEVMRSLDDLGLVTEAPLVLVNWTDEEGTRFGRGLVGSGVWSGAVSLATALALTDTAGTSVAAALAVTGIAGPAPATAFPVDAYFELHIEQGPILEREAAMIGIVTGAQGILWFDAATHGQEAHSGTTPPAARRDALVSAARIIDLVDRMMRARGETGRGTVGWMEVRPNSRNVIPGEVRFSVEFRHPDEAELDRLEAQFPREAGFIARDGHVRLSVSRRYRSPVVAFDAGCVGLVEAASSALGFASRRMVSGAGHDAVNLVARAPTAMIFVPCKDGLSHNPAESITPEAAEAGCLVLLEAVLARANQTRANRDSA